MNNDLQDDGWVFGIKGRYEKRLRGRETYIHTMTPAEVLNDHIHYQDCSSCIPDGETFIRWLVDAGYVITHPDDG